MILPPTPTATWIERYETLRRHVLNGGHVLDREPLSLILWMSQGMAGWMRHWAEAAAQTWSSAGVLPPPRFSTSSLWQEQLTLVLAQMTLQRLYPVTRL